MRAVHLIRHGATQANENHLYCGATDVPLSLAGEAALLALREKCAYPDISGCRVLTSGMRRADDTLSLLYGAAAHEKEPGLREMDFGAFEMRSYEELCGDPVYIEWITGDNVRKRCPGGESGVEMEARAIRAFERILSAHEGDLLIVTHGGVISTVMTRLFPDAGRNFYEWQPKNGEGFTVLLSEDKAERWYAIPAARAR